MKKLKRYSLFTLIVSVVLFLAQNLGVVEVKFLFWSIQISRSIFIFILLLLGIIMGWLLHSSFKHKG